MSAGLPSLLQSFFTDRLFRQRRASPNTIAGYRDSFRLLFHFAKERLGKAPSNLMIDDLNVSFISDFLDDLENAERIALALGISVWPRFTPSFSTWLSRSLPMRCSASESWRCPPNATNGGPSNFSIGKRSTPSWRQPILHLDRAPRPDTASAHRSDGPPSLRVD